MRDDLCWDEITSKLKFSFAEAWQSRTRADKGTTVNVHMSVPEKPS